MLGSRLFEVGRVLINHCGSIALSHLFLILGNIDTWLQPFLVSNMAHAHTLRDTQK